MFASGESRGSETEAGEGVGSPLTDRLIVTSGCTVPAGATALLVGEPPAKAHEHHVLRRAGRFPKGTGGEFAEACLAGPAIAQLEDLRRARGAAYLIIPMTSFAWLADRPELTDHLMERYRLQVEDESCWVFDLRETPINAFIDAILPSHEPVMMMVRGQAHLTLGARRVYRVASVPEVDAPRPEGVRFLVVPDVSPWTSEDRGILRVLEHRYLKVATRPGVCEMFDVTQEAEPPRAGRPRWRRVLARVFGNG